MSATLRDNFFLFFKKFRVLRVSYVTFIFVWGRPYVGGGKWILNLINLKVGGSGSAEAKNPPTQEDFEALSNHLPHISVRGVLLWTTALVTCGYLFAAGVFLQLLQSRYPKIELNYFDLALPTRWAGLNEKRGTALIIQGRELLSTNDFQHGFSLLRHGLARSPANMGARHDVARIYAGMRLHAQAIKLLEDGLTLGAPSLPYLKTLFDLLSYSDQPEKELATIRKVSTLLASKHKSENDAEIRHFLAVCLAASLFDNDKFEEAERHVVSTFPEDDIYRQRYLAYLYLKRSPQAAAQAAEKWSQLEPESVEPLHAWIIALRHAKDFKAMDQVLDRLYNLKSSHPEALVFRIVQNHLAGRADLAGASLDRLFIRHGATESLYPIVCDALLGAGYADAFDRVEIELRERGLSLHPVHWARVKYAVAQANWGDVLYMINKLQNSRGPVFKRDEVAYLTTMKKLANTCIEGGSGTQNSLVEEIGDNPGSLNLYKTVISALLDANRYQAAKQIFVLAEGPFPDAVSLQRLKPRLDHSLALVDASDLKSLRRNTQPATWVEFKAKFKTLLMASPTAALESIVALRRNAPDWLEANRLEVDLLELPLRARGDDPASLRVVVRSVLLYTKNPELRLVGLAEEIQETFPANARMIIKELLRVYPENDDALKMQKRLDPEPEVLPLTPSTNLL